MDTLAITRLNSGGVITNYHCVSRCGHCLYNCGPHRGKDYLEAATAEIIFKRIAGLGCWRIHLGGGEPLLAPQKLIDVLGVASTQRITIDYVETNCAWFVDARQAEVLLTQLLAAGLHTLLVSISPFHNAFIPFDRVKGVMKACQRTGMTIFPWVEAFVDDLNRLDPRQPHGMDVFEDQFGAAYLARIPDRYWIHMGGRALKTFTGVYPGRPLEKILADSPPDCTRALSDTSHFHIDLYGNYIPGLCAGLVMDMDDLGRPVPPGKYPLLERLAGEGVQGLHAWAAQHYDYTPRKKGFLNHCDLCTDIRSYLMQKDGALFPDLGPKGFYAELVA